MKCAAWKPLLLAVICAALLTLAASPTSAQGKKGPPPPPTNIRYSMELISGFGTAGVEVGGMNNHGDVVGRSDSRAFLSTVVGGTRITVDLNELITAEDKALWRDLNIAYGINDAGQIVGNGHQWGDQTPRGFRFTPGYTDAGGDHPAVVDDLGLSINPLGINGWGDVTGDYASPDGNRAFVLSASGFQDLGVLYPEHNFSRGKAINAFGQVAGFSGTNPGYFRSFLYNPGTGMRDLGIIKAERGGTSQSFANALNDQGDVVGYASAGGTSKHAYRWSAGVMQDLGTLGGSNSSASSINNSGYVVGRSQISSTSESAFLFHSSLGMTNLEPLITNLPAALKGQLATDTLQINDAGQIMGWGYILTPLP